MTRSVVTKGAFCNYLGGLGTLYKGEMPVINSMVYSSNPQPEGQPEEKSDLPELGLEEYHSFEYRISDLNSQTVTVKSDRHSERAMVNPDHPSPQGTTRQSGFTVPLFEGQSGFTNTVKDFV